MAVVFRYGGYSSGDDEAELTKVEKQPTFSGRGKRLTHKETWHVNGELMQATPALIIAAANSLITAFAQDGKTATFTVSGTEAHRLSSDSVSGVRVVYTSFEKQDPAELATVRTYQIVLEATYDACDDNLVAWEESLEITGTGGPYTIAIETMDGPQLITMSNRTGFYYTQSGQAVGYLTYPNTPGPIDPQAEFAFRRRVRRKSGRQMGNGIRFYTITWVYYFARDPAGFGGTVPEFPTSK